MCYIMVLLVNNQMLDAAPDCLHDFYTRYPHLLHDAQVMAAKKPAKVDTTGILYVRQKQWAATQPGELLDNGQVLDLVTVDIIRAMLQEVTGCGTDDLLTCHAIIFRDSVSGVTAIAHFDEFSRKWDFEGMEDDFLNKVNLVRQRTAWEYDEEAGDGDWEWWDDEEEIQETEHDPEAIYELHLLGGYADDSKRGHKLTQRFMHHLHHDVKMKLNIVSCCLGPPNTK